MHQFSVCRCDFSRSKRSSKCTNFLLVEAIWAAQERSSKCTNFPSAIKIFVTHPTHRELPFFLSRWSSIISSLHRETFSTIFILIQKIIFELICFANEVHSIQNIFLDENAILKALEINKSLIGPSQKRLSFFQNLPHDLLRNHSCRILFLNTRKW